MATVEILGFAPSSYTRVARMACEEKGVPYELFGYIFPKTADGKPDRATIDGAVPALRQQIAVLDKAVAPTGHLAGDRLGFADINLMPILFYVKMFPEGAEALAGANALAAYYERHAQRSSFRNTVPPMPGR